MALARELIETYENADESGGRTTSTRIFQADVPQAVALDPAVITNIPQIDDVHPADPAQTVYSRTATYERGSVTTSRIVIRYSSDPPTWGGNNPADPFFKSWNLSYYRVAQPIPYAVEDPRSLRYTDATGTTQFIKSYPVAFTSHWESRSKFMRRCRVTQMTAAQWEPIQDFTNKLCKIYNRWYLFTVSDLQETSRNVWDVTYTFEFDPGTPSGVFPIEDNLLFPDGLGPVRPMPGIATFWTRPPYHEVRVIPGSGVGGVPFWPAFFAVCPYEVLATGHLTLPGFGPL